MKVKFTFLLASLLLSGLMNMFAQATANVEFTAAQGYVNGELNNQPASGAKWAAPPGHFIVDATAGKVSIPDASSWQRTTYGLNLATGGTTKFTIAMKFSFDRSTDLTGGGWNEIIGFAMQTVAGTGAGQNVGLYFRRQQTDNTKYDLATNTNKGGWRTSTTFNESDLGFGAEKASSDELMLELTITKGADSTTWTGVSKLRNLTKDTEIISWNLGGNINVSDIFHGSTAYYGTMLARQTATSAKVSNRTISNFEVSSGFSKFALTLVADPLGAGTLTGAGLYDGGASVPITATAANNYQFVKWTLADGITEVSTVANFSYTMPAASTTLKAHFTQVIVDFTTAQGYVDGDLSTQTPSDGVTWTAPATHFIVDATAGKVSIPDASAWQRPKYNRAFVSGTTTFALAKKFSFDRSLDAYSGAHPIMGIYLQHASNNLWFDFTLNRSGATNYRIGYFINATELTGEEKYRNSGDITPAALGFSDAADTSSDELTLELMLTKGIDADSWTAVGKVLNGSTEVFSWDFGGTPFKVGATFHNSTELYGGLSVREGITNSKISNRTITTFKVSPMYPIFTGTAAWTNHANWDTGVVPASGMSVIVNGDATVNSSVGIGMLTINSGKSLTVNPGKDLTISNALINSGTLTLKSDETGTATIKTDGSISGAGSTTVKQYLATDRNWYVSSPIASAAIPAAQNVWYYDETETNLSNSWKAPSVSLEVGRGYIVNPTAAEVTLNFEGALNNGDKSIILTKTTAKTSQVGFNLVGNPYPSFIDATTLLSTNSTKIEGNVWYRTHTGTAYQFQTYNGPGNASVPQAANPSYIPPMQSFWVRALENNVQLEFTNAMRKHNETAGAILLRAPESKSAERQLIRLQVSNGSATDEALLYFDAAAVNGYDRFDSPKMFNNNATIPEIFTAAGNEKLVINGMNNYNNGTSIPLGFYPGQSGSFSIKASQVNNFDADTRIVLVDNTTQSEFDLSAGDTYSFSSDAVNTTDRFSVLFKSASGTTSIEETGAGNMFVTADNGRLTLQLYHLLHNNARITVYNATGQNIHTQALHTQNTVLNRNFDAGVYLLKVENGSKPVVMRTLVY